LRNYNLLAAAVNTAMAHDKALALTLQDGRVVEGKIVMKTIDRLSPKGARSNLLVTVEGHEPIRLADVEAARWS
jgi:hypothetical protein